MTQNNLIKSLIKQAEEDFKTAVGLYENKRYNYSLFFGQLVLEKLFKALIVKKINRVYPPSHSLTKLAKMAKIKLTKQQRAELEEITSYNIKARYDDIKFSFYKKANKKYTQKWFTKIKEYSQWLKSQF